ncbi:MAG: glycosyltransferase family 4 protein [Candidatus Aminicenantes bacterium]|nr:MAG: glycosyltransferase family 4 protein [Candidatus Aminicenantes bacterium]
MKKKILFSPGISKKVVGGAEYQMSLLAKYLEREEHSIYGILKENLRNEAKYENLFLTQKSMLQTWFKFTYSRKIYRYLKQIKPDIIYQRGELPYLAVGCYYKKKHGGKTIWHISSKGCVSRFHFRFGFSLFGYIDKKFADYSIRNVDYIIAQTHDQNELLKKNYGRESDLVVPNFDKLPQDEISKSPPLRVVWISNIKPIKKAECFIPLAQEFEGRKDIRFVMIGREGSRSYQEKIDRMISGMTNVEYLGEISHEEVNAFLGKSHILVNTSLSEGFPNTFIQAWMRKVPVVSLYVDPDGILRKNKIGFCSGSIEQMIDDVKQLTDNKELREEMGERAQEYAFEKHTFEENMAKIVDLIFP